MRLTIDETMDLIDACPDARRWAKQFGKRAFKKAWMSCHRGVWLHYVIYHLQWQLFGFGLRPTVHDRNIHMIEKSIHSWWQHNGYGRVVPGRVVRSVVSWECFRDPLEQVDDMLRRQL